MSAELKTPPAPPVARLGLRRNRTRVSRVGRIIFVSIGILMALIVSAAGVLLLIIGPDRPGQFERRVESLKKRLMNPAPQDVVLLAGSSYFELWDTSSRDLEELNTVNVGIGGTKIGDQIFYLDRVVFPFNPRALVVYAGSNDINGFPFFSKTADEVVPRVKEYVSLVHKKFPNLPVYYVAITEAPIRTRVREEIQNTNRMLAAWAEQTREITFIDTAPALLTSSGDIDPSIFRGDRLHLNEKGYEKFAAVIRSALIPDLFE